jgi:hypothetical protein
MNERLRTCGRVVAAVVTLVGLVVQPSPVRAGSLRGRCGGPATTHG